MKYLLILTIIFVTKVEILADSLLVNVASKQFIKQLPKGFYIPNQFEVKQIYKVDLNNDGKEDKVIIWKKKVNTQGDTIKASLYFKKDSTDIFVKTLTNIYTLDFEYWSSKSTGNKKLDSLKELYVDSNFDKVEFIPGKIIIGLSTSSFDGCDYYFQYDPKRNNWYLENMQHWEGWNYLDRKKSSVQKVEVKIPIDKFRILTVLGY